MLKMCYNQVALAAKRLKRSGETAGERSTPKPPEELNDVLGCSSSGGGPKSKEEKKARSQEAAATTTTTGPQR